MPLELLRLEGFGFATELIGLTVDIAHDPGLLDRENDARFASGTLCEGLHFNNRARPKVLYFKGLLLGGSKSSSLDHDFGRVFRN
jgi:hypothetical protein